MSVQDGQGVNATITNAAFLSRLNDSSTIGKQDFNNAAESTGPTNGSIHTQGGLGVEKSLNVGLNANVNGTLTVVGTTTAGTVNATQVNASGNITSTAQVLADSLDIVNNANVNSLSVETSATVATNLTVTGNASAANLTASAQVSAATLQTTGSATIGDDLTVTDNIQTNTLQTTGLATLNSLSVTNAASVGTNLTVTGSVSAASASVAGSVSSGSSSVSGNQTVGGTLGVTGNASLSTLSTSGQITANSLSVTNAASVGGNLTVTGNLQVNGTTTTVGSANLVVTDKNIFVNNGGNDASSEGAGLTVDRTGTDGSLIYKDTSASKWAAGPLGSETDLVNVSGSQVLTNKTISGANNTISNVSLTTGVTGTLPVANGGTNSATALNNNRVMVSSSNSIVENAALTASSPVRTTSTGLLTTGQTSLATEVTGTLPVANGGTGQTTITAAFNALSPITTKGDLISFDGTNDVRLPVGTSGQILSADPAEATGLKWINNTGGSGSSGGGAFNLISSGDYEAGVQIFTAYNDSSTTRPVDGIGGTPTLPAAGFISTNTIRGNGSFALSKDAANRQGQGWAVSSIAVPQEFRAKSLKLSMAYKFLTAGAFAAGSNGSSPTDGDAIVYFYDETNAKLVEPSNIKFFSNSTLVDQFEATVQFDSTCTSVRLIVHVASTSTVAWQLILDSITLSPQNYVYGSAILDERLYVPSSTAGFGSISAVALYWSQIGENLKVSGRFTLGTTTAVQAQLGLPDGLSIKSGLDNRNIGTFGRGVGGQTNKGGFILGQGGNSFVTFTVSDVIGSSAADPTSNAVGTGIGNSGNVLFVEFMVPIQGWTASSRISDGFDSRNIAFKATKVGGNQNGSSGVNTFTSKVDTCEMFNLSTGVARIPSAGDYLFGINYEWVAPQAVGFTIRVGGAVDDTYDTSSSSLYGTHSILLRDLKAGDSVTVTSSTGSVLNLTRFIFWGSKVQAPQTIAAGEKVSFILDSTNGVSMSAGVATLIRFNIKTIDTHGIYNTSTGRFSLPRSGTAQLSARLVTSSLNPAGAPYMEIAIYKNGSFHRVLSGDWKINVGTSTYQIGCGSTLIEGTSNDYFEIYASSTSATSTFAGTGINYLTLEMR